MFGKSSARQIARDPNRAREERPQSPLAPAIFRHSKPLTDLPGKWIDRARQHRSLDKLILDLDSSVSQTCGRRERLGDQRRGEPKSGASAC